jgi:predicted anti-sigma-YlaC factor YlaD
MCKKWGCSPSLFVDDCDTQEYVALNTDQCDMNTRQLLAYLQAPSQYPAIEAHLETCPSCRRRLAHLSQAVVSHQADRLTCGQCQARLPDYVQAQMEARDPAGLFPEVQDHLALCPHCQRLYQDLLEIDELTLTGSLPEPITYSPPDLSFLKRLSVPERFGEISRRGAYWAQDRARVLVVDMGTFFQALGRQPALALAVRGEEYELKGLLYQIVLGPENLDDLDVEMTISRQFEGPEVVRVVVHVRVPGRLVAGFAGSQVQMRAGETTWAVRTDEDGRAVFEDVPLHDLKEATFEIVPA